VLNSVVLIGRLAQDPSLRYTESGVAVGGFTLAVDRPRRENGEKQADFIDVVVWRGLAETCANHLSKGRLVAVRGRLQIRSYETQDGQKRRVAEVVADEVKFLDRKRDDAGSAESAQDADLPDLPDEGKWDDDIPF